MPRLLGRGAAVSVLCLIAGVYGCDAGHGFVKDDFVWIATSRVQTGGDLIRQLGAGTGFFRPIVSLSFVVDRAIFDRAPLAYGLTNLALLFACIGVLPPHDHPHIYLAIEDATIVCPYCSTLFRFDPRLDVNATEPPGLYFEEPG